MTAGFIAQASAGLLCLGLLLVIFGWAVAVISQIGKPGRFNISHGERPVGFAFSFIMAGALLSAIAIIGLLVAGLWWMVPYLFASITPGWLAILSIGVGVFPIVLSALASLTAKAMGGSVSASGADNCILLGRDIGSLIYTLFMSYMLAYFTVGLAVLGLIGSGIWAIIR